MLCDIYGTCYTQINVINDLLNDDANPGHPAQVFMKENNALLTFLEKDFKPAYAEFMEDQDSEKMLEVIDEFYDTNEHYLKKRCPFSPLWKSTI